MKFLKMLIAISFGMLVAACGGGGGGDSTLTPAADFSGTWSSSSTGLAYSAVQSGTNVTMTRIAPVSDGITYTGVVNGNSANLTIYINGASVGTATVTLTNSTTATLTVNSCNPPAGYTCAAPGSVITATRVLVPGTSVETFQVKTAFVNYVSDSRSLPFTVVGTASGISVTGSGTLTQSTLTSTTFEGLAVLQKVSTITGSLVGNGVTVPLATTSTSYIDSSYTLKGAFGAEYMVVTSGGGIPATAKVNDTGNWYTANRYATSAKTNFLGTTDVTYVLQPDTATTALLKLIQIDKNTAGTVMFTSTLIFRITPAGGLTRLSETGADSTTSLTITY